MSAERRYTRSNRVFFLYRLHSVFVVGWSAMAAAVSAHAGQLTLAWDPVLDATGYKLHYGVTSGDYTDTVVVSDTIQHTLTGLQEARNYCIVASAYNQTTESGFSNEVCATVPPSATPPSADFSASPTSGTVPLTVHFSDASSGKIKDYSWDFGDGGKSTSADPSHIYEAVGTYTVTLTTTGPGGSDTYRAADYIAVEASDGQDGPIYEQDDGAADLLVMEAEVYTDHLPQGGHEWVEVADPLGYAGDGLMLATPDDGARIDDDYVMYSPRLDYDVRFVRSGTHYLWLRGRATSPRNNSAHVGLNGKALASADRIQFSPGFGWGWTSETMDDLLATVEVPAPGYHTINLWMRESGLQLDRVLLTSDRDFVPSGIGPAVTWSDGRDSCSVACSFWDYSATPSIVQESDWSPVELGMRFQSEVDGTVLGIRFYKGPENTGTHVGSLWSDTGDLLAQVTFRDETESGWQEAIFPAPVAIQANTAYVISYHAPNGRYSLDEEYFSAEYITGALTAPAAGDKANGVYRYGSGGFPTDGFRASNYWVDVVFATP